MDEQSIEDVRLPAAGDKADYLVIFFHGYDSSGQDMADYMGDALTAALPSAAVRFADAPLETPWDGNGRSWFAIEDHLDGPADGNVMAPRALEAMPDILNYIDRVLEDESIGEDRLILAGFSQGATMAFYAALQRENPVAGVFSVSGGALDQVQGIKSKPQIMLLAGAEESSYYSGRELAAHTHNLLQQNGFRSTLYLTPENGHDMNGESICKLIEFCERVAPKPSPSIAPPLPKPGF